MDTLLKIHYRADKVAVDIVVLADAYYVFKQLFALRLMPAIGTLVNGDYKLLRAFNHAE
jgi:hypothetical protein